MQNGATESCATGRRGDERITFESPTSQPPLLIIRKEKRKRIVHGRWLTIDGSIIEVVCFLITVYILVFLIIFLFLGGCWSCWYRMRSAPISHCTSALCATKTTLAHSGWWTMRSLSSAAICPVVDLGNMTPPHHPLHPTCPARHSKHRISNFYR